MRGVTQVLQVKARLVASTMPEQVQAVASRLHELADPVAAAAVCLAAFDGDAAYCDYVARKVLEDREWVSPAFKRRSERGLPVDAQSMIVARIVWLARHKFRARAAR